MAVPSFEEFLYPFLKVLENGPCTVDEMRHHLKKHFNLSPNDMSKMTKSGKVSCFNDRINWSRQYMRRALMVVIPKRGVYEITDRGKQYLANHTDMRIEDLMQYEEFAEFAHRPNMPLNTPETIDKTPGMGMTPTDQMESAFDTIQNDLASDLLAKILEKSPGFFERLVVDLLVKMGYGNSTDYTKMLTPISHDGGIDGIIPQDKLGLDKIYIQAKKYASDNTVGRQVIQSFSGALSGHHGKKGVFITTSSYSKDALDYVETLDQKIILIDGRQLTKYMIEYNVGVSTKKVYEIKRIDSDYFEEE